MEIKRPINVDLSTSPVRVSCIAMVITLNLGLGRFIFLKQATEFTFSILIFFSLSLEKKLLVKCTCRL